MNYSSSNRGFPAGNPIANALVIIVGALAIGASLVLGFFAFVVLASIIIVLSGIVGIRLWWFNRKLKKAAERAGRTDRPKTTGVIEGEYRVIVEERDDRDA